MKIELAIMQKIKANEKLLYAIITVLSNKEGYCFASNSYLGNLLNAKPHTISKWVSHLKELGFVCLDIIRNDKGEIIQRRIYPNDTPYSINRTYPYSIEKTEGMSQKGQYNNITDNNINNKIDRLFNYILDNEKEVPEEFINVEYNEIIVALKRYEMLYSKDSIDYMSKENLDKIESGLEGLNFEMIGEGMAYFKNDGKSYKEIKTFLDSYLDINFSGYMVSKIKDTVDSLKRHPIYKMSC